MLYFLNNTFLIHSYQTALTKWSRKNLDKIVKEAEQRESKIQCFNCLKMDLKYSFKRLSVFIIYVIKICAPFLLVKI